MDKIYTYRGNLDFSYEPHRIKLRKVVHYDMLLSTVQLWGQSYYHFLIEIMPRLAVAAPLAAQYPDCKILIPSFPKVREFLDFAGFHDHDRFVLYDEGQKYGYSARVLLLPKATPCGMPSRTSLEALRKLIFKEANKLDTIVLIERTKGSRALEGHGLILEALRASFPQYNVVTFRGSETLATTRDIFARAAVIVGPHGAGFANIIFRFENVLREDI